MSDSFEPRVEDDEVVEAFFSQPPPAPYSGSERWEPRPMTVSERKAMTATFAMLGFFAAVSVCFAAYAELAMVRPAALSAAGLPRPSAAVSTDTETASAVLDAERAAALTAVVTATTRQAAPLARTATEHAQSGQHALETASQRTPTASATTTLRSPVRARVAARERPIRAGASSTAEATTKRAYAELKRGHTGDAMQLAGTAIRLDPSRASAYIALAGARDAIGDHAGARAAFRECAQRAQDRLVSACKTLAR
jgi:tetratricopeptide (TPR) repeat protein